MYTLFAGTKRAGWRFFLQETLIRRWLESSLVDKFY
jgi:hypothetical protein